MERRRWVDRLVGAGAAVGVLVLLAVVLLWVASEPTDAGDAAPAPSATVPPAAAEAPSDLAAGETWLGDLTLDAGSVVTPDARLLDVAAVGQDVRAGTDGLTAGSLVVDATVPFDVVAAELGDGVTVAAADDGEASVTRSVEVAGRTLRVVATGTVEVVGGRLVVEPTSIDIGGPDFLSGAIGSVVRRLVTIEQDVEGVPEGLDLRDVQVTPDGFRAHLDGTDVRLVS